MPSYDPENVHGSRLCRDDWYALKRAVLSAYDGMVFSIPQHLIDHRIAKNLLSLSDEKVSRDAEIQEAMKLLVPGSSMYYIVLTKS